MKQRATMPARIGGNLAALEKLILRLARDLDPRYATCGFRTIDLANINSTSRQHGVEAMRIFKETDAAEYKSRKVNMSLKDIQSNIPPATSIPFIPFEILGESINPLVSTSPAVLQGTFIQLTNLDPEISSYIFLGYAPTAPFEQSAGNVALGANFIDGDLNIFDFTADFMTGNYLSVNVPPQQTFIVGPQYYFSPPSGLEAPIPQGKEAMGNRGFVLVLPLQGAGFLVTATIRQTFISSLSSMPTIISSAAYSVPISTGPIITPSSGTADLLA